MSVLCSCRAVLIRNLCHCGTPLRGSARLCTAFPERIYTHVTQSIVARYGKQYDWSVKAEMMGMPQRDAANFIIDKLDLP